MAENPVKRLIAEVPFFKGLSDTELDEIQGIARPQSYPRHRMLFSDGDAGKGFFLVTEGRVKVFKTSPDGKEQILHIFGPGEPIGQVAVFAGESFPASAQAMEDSRALFFPRDAFVRLIERRPSLALNMLAILSQRLREFTVQIENLSLKEVPSRLAGYLLSLAEERKSPGIVELGMTKAQLASLIGTIPETLSRIFNRMAQAGLIQVEGRTIRLLDGEALEDLAGHGKLQ